jgi:hypothetical protein
MDNQAPKKEHLKKIGIAERFMPLKGRRKKSRRPFLLQLQNRWRMMLKLRRFWRRFIRFHSAG